MQGIKLLRHWNQLFQHFIFFVSDCLLVVLDLVVLGVLFPVAAVGIHLYFGVKLGDFDERGELFGRACLKLAPYFLLLKPPVTLKRSYSQSS